MPSTIATEKAALRREARARAGGLSPQARRRSDDALLARFLALPGLERYRRVLLYHGMGLEPDTGRLIAPLLDAGHAVALPRCLPGNLMEARLVQRDTVLVRHPFGMLEPGEACPVLAREDVDLALVPGLAFDRSGGRLGRGGGFYDRWLAGFSGRTVALCRNCLLYEALPRAPFDLGVELVVTETGQYGGMLQGGPLPSS